MRDTYNGQTDVMQRKLESVDVSDDDKAMYAKWDEVLKTGRFTESLKVCMYVCMKYRRERR